MKEEKGKGREIVYTYVGASISRRSVTQKEENVVACEVRSMGLRSQQLYLHGGGDITKRGASI